MNITPIAITGNAGVVNEEHPLLVAYRNIVFLMMNYGNFKGHKLGYNCLLITTLRLYTTFTYITFASGMYVMNIANRTYRKGGISRKQWLRLVVVCKDIHTAPVVLINDKERNAIVPINHITGFFPPVKVILRTIRWIIIDT